MSDYQVVNPATGETLAEYQTITDEQLQDAIGRVDKAHREWAASSTVDERATLIRRVAELHVEQRQRLAEIILREMGKPIEQALGEVDFAAAIYEYYADNAAELLADESIKLLEGDGSAFIRRSSYGPLLGIMPWNYPYYQVARFAGPNLAIGNTILLKHAPQCPESAEAMEQIFHEAGFPADAYINIFATNDQIETVIADPRVKAVTLTGSEGAGRAVAAIAGRELKKTVLELGGSDPFVVMPSADIEAAATVATTARCQNNGQSCIAAKRFIVHTDVYDAFAAAFVAKMAALNVGDPMVAGTDVGPLATEQGRADVEEQVRDAVAKGASVLCGGQRPDRAGWFYPPTVVGDLTPDMAMYAEEVFGPVAGLYRVASREEALQVANGTDFGLGSNAWTNDEGEQAFFIDGLDAGAVFINGMTTSYAELPFGGVRHSGYGRELSSHGIKEFCNAKTVWVGGTAVSSAGAGDHSE